MPLDKKFERADRSNMKKVFKCPNDEARSISICYAIKGTKITVFDNPDLKKNDDWTTIEVEETLNRCYTIGTFEKTQRVGDLSVKYRYMSNLDGKVSSFAFEIGEITYLVLE